MCGLSGAGNKRPRTFCSRDGAACAISRDAEMNTEMNDFPFGAAIRHAWDLDPAVAYLNHGSFGVTPRTVLAAQAEWQRKIERGPAAFMTRVRMGLLREAAAPVAAYLGARGEDLAFMENATSA